MEKYFKFDDTTAARDSPGKVAAYVAALVKDNAYVASLNTLGKGPIKGRYISIITSFLVPAAYYMTFGGQGPSFKMEHALQSISNAYIALLCTAAHNVIVQWTTGTHDSKAGLGNFANQSCEFIPPNPTKN